MRNMRSMRSMRNPENVRPHGAPAAHRLSALLALALMVWCAGPATDPGLGAEPEDPRLAGPSASALEAMDAAAEVVAPGDRDFATLCRWLTGSFSSAAQAAADTAYHDIHLQMVPIWPERSDACWLYVEQAVGSSLERPYRQRVYRVAPLGENLYESAVYTLADPEAAVGAWREERPLARLTPDDLDRRDGCAVLLRRDPGGEFSGGTIGRGCESTLGDAAYATSEIRLWSGGMETWDRGYTPAGEQAWGAEQGPYVFLRR